MNIRTELAVVLSMSAKHQQALVHTVSVTGTLPMTKWLQQSSCNLLLGSAAAITASIVA